MRNPLYDPERVAAQLCDDGLDALVLASTPNILYATRYRKQGPALAILERERPSEPSLVIPAPDVDFLLEDVADGVEVAAYGHFFRQRADGVDLGEREALVARVHEEARADLDQFGVAAAILLRRGLEAATIGCDVPVALVTGLTERLPHGTFVDARPLIRRLRMVKTPEEIERLRTCAALAEEAIAETVAHARVGMTQRELAVVFNTALAARSARTRLDNVSVGRSTALGNVNIPDDRVRPGSVIRFDVGAMRDGYCSDLSRCYAVQPVDDRVATYHRALVEGLEAALASVRPGVRATELFEVAVAAVRAAGIPHYRRTNVGHGIGIAGDGYDAPLLAPADQTAIESGMVLCVETPYYELGFAGLQVEDMVAVTADGFATLSELPRGLQAIA